MGMPCLMPKDLLCRLDNRGMQRQTGPLSFKEGKMFNSLIPFLNLYVDIGTLSVNQVNTVC